MFISGYYENTIVNLDHIVKVYITEPQLEQRDYRVYALLSFGGGTVTLHRGTAESCAEYLKNFVQIAGKNSVI